SLLSMLKTLRSTIFPYTTLFRSARTVVDLHIEKLSNDWQHLSNAEILDIQLKEFEKWYELALAHHQSHLIVIHGVGSGRLRDERSEEHTSELQSRGHLVCRLLLE